MLTRPVMLLFGCVLCSTPPIAEAGLESGLASFQQGDYQTAYRELRPLAEAQDPQAQYHIGFMHYSGKGVGQNNDEALKWLKPAAEHGVSDAQYLLGVMTEAGLDGPKLKKQMRKREARDKAEAVKWYALASEQGHVNAQVKLADRYLHGEGVPRDPIQAYAWCGIAHLLAPSRCNPQQSIPAYQMTPAQLDEAKQRVQTWVRAHPVNSAHPSAKSAPQLLAELDRADLKRKTEIRASLILMGDAASPAILGAFRGQPIRHVDVLTGVLCERGTAAVGAAPELIRMFRNPAITPSVKHHFLQALACVGRTSPETQSLLISLVKDGDDALRPWAVMALERFDSPDVVVALAAALSDPHRSVREAAAGALVAMGPKAAPAVPALTKAMGQKGTYLAMIAENALRAIGTPDAMAELKKRGTDNQWESSDDVNGTEPAPSIPAPGR